MTDTLTRIDDLERRVFRVERHLGLARGRDAEEVSARRGPVAPLGVAPEAPAPVASYDWMQGSRARDSAPVTSRRALMEQFVQRAKPALDPAPSQLPPRAAPAPVPAPPVAAELPPPAAPVAPPPLPPRAAPVPVQADVDLGLADARVSAPTPATPATLRYEPRPAAPQGPPRQSALEQAIGLKLAGWVGAIVLVIGAGLGIKYAYDQGFFSGVHPAIWLSLLYACGFALLGAGEFVFRKVNKISATGLFGAGVATLFLVSYAGHGYYELYQQQTAFTLMALSTLIGAAVAMRGKLVSIAALSLVGGLLAPLVLDGDTNLVTPFLAYLLMLQVVALVLSWWGGSARWWTLRGLSLTGTALWMTAVLWKAQPWGAAMTFTFLYAALYHAEVIFSAFRKRAASREDVELSAGVGFTVAVTAILAGATLWLFAGAEQHVRGLWVAGFATAAAALGFALHAFRADPRLRALAYGYRVQAAVLLLLAIPITFAGASISLGWAAVAIALAAVGAKLDDKPSLYTAVAAWTLAVINAAWWTIADPTRAAARAEWLHVLGQPIVAWTVIGWSLVFVGHAVAWLVSRRDEREGRSLSFIATGLFAAVTIAALPPLGATAVLIAYTWLLVGGDVLVGRLKLLPQAWAVLALAVAKWVAVDTFAARLSPTWSAATYTPLLNPMMLTGLALAGSIVAIYRLRRDAIQARFAAASEDGAVTRPAVLVLTAVALLIAIGLSFEVDRAVMRVTQSAWPIGQLRQMAWTMLWTMIAAAYLWLYTKLDPAARRRDEWRGMAWVLAGALAIKFVVSDTLLTRVAGSAAVTPAPLLNFQVLVAAVVTGGLGFVYWLFSHDEQGERDERTPLRVGLAALAVLLWAGTLEIDRLIASGAFPGTAVWPAWQLRHFAWTAWWTAGACGFIAIATRRDETLLRRVPMLRALASVPVLLAVKYLVLDTLLFRLFRGPAGAAVVANLQTFAGAVVFGALILVRHWMSGADARDALSRQLRRTAGALAMVMLLWLGSLEVDRAFERSATVMSAFADPRIAKQVALSIFWSAFAIGSVAAGFKLRTAGLRYFGLALFALTLLKIGVIDLRNAETGYRILSFMGLGALLLGTSVLYGKLSPVLLREENREIAQGE